MSRLTHFYIESFKAGSEYAVRSKKIVSGTQENTLPSILSQPSLSAAFSIRTSLSRIAVKTSAIPEAVVRSIVPVVPEYFELTTNVTLLEYSG